MTYLSNKKKLKIGRLELVLEEGGYGQTKSTKDRYLMSYLSNKKRILNNKKLLLMSNDAEFYANYFVFERQNRGIDTFTVKCKKVKKCSKI